MAKAIAYGTKRWPALSRFLDDGRLEIDNNIAERALRGVAVRRRNWLFAGSRVGGERAAAIYTVIQTCKANGAARPRMSAVSPASRCSLMPWPTLHMKNTTTCANGTAAPTTPTTATNA